MVFVTKLSNLLLDAANKHSSVATYLATVPAWKEYESGRLSEINVKENTKLGESRGDTGKIEIEDNILYDFFCFFPEREPANQKIGVSSKD